MAKKLVPTQHESNIAGAVSDAFSALEELAGEMRDAYDNTPENLQGQGVGEARGEAADALEGISEPDAPQILDAVRVTYAQDTYGKRGPSRADRCGDACAILYAVVQRLEEWLEEKRDEVAKHDEETGEPVYALLSAQGTACAETVLRGEEYTEEGRARAEAQFCTGTGPDVPVAGTWADVSDNDALNGSDKRDEMENLIGEVEEYRDEVQQMIDDAEGVTFPGMYG